MPSLVAGRRSVARLGGDDRTAIISRASCSAPRGLVVGAHRARITFRPFRAAVAPATMLATSAGSTRASEMRRSATYSAADSKDKDDDEKGGSAGSKSNQGGAGGSAGTDGGGPAGGGTGGGAPIKLTLVDGASPDNKDDAKCTKQMLSDSPKVGSGPRFAGFSAGTDDIRLGLLEGTLLAVAVETGSNTDDRGVVGTVDIVTGERKVLSGKCEDPAEGTVVVGKGPTLNEVFGVIRSSSGKLLATVKPKATEYSTVSVDPATGDRTELINYPSTRATCEGLEGDVFFQHRSGLVEGPSGELYVQINKDQGSGIGRIDKDGKCKALTYTNSNPDLNIGPGANVPNGEYNNLTLHDGALWTTHFVGEAVLKIGLKDGKRTKVSSPAGGGSIGDGPKLGTQAIGFDGDKVWTAGDGQKINLVRIDPKNGDRTLTSEDVKGGPLTVTVSGTPGLWPVPGTGIIVTEVGNAIVLFDPENNNSNVASF